MKVKHKIKIIITLVVILISGVFATDVVYGTSNNTVPEPILYYNFDNEDATDLANTYTGEIINSPKFVTSKLEFGKALEISNGSYIKLPNNFKLGEGDFSISFLVKSLESKNDTVLFANKDGSSGKHDGFSIMNYNGVFGNAAHNDTRYDTSSYSRDETVLDGNWRHVVIQAKRDESLAIYVDGKLSSKNSEFKDLNGISLDTDQNYVLGAGSTGEYQQAALYDEFKVFNQALSADEVLNLYLASVGDVQLELTQMLDKLISGNIKVPLKANQEMKTKEVTLFLKKQINDTNIELNVDYIRDNIYSINLSKASKTVSKEMNFNFNEKDVLTIASYNMYGWGYPDLEEINRKLESIDADIVGLQEANWQPDGNGQVDRLAKIGSYPYNAFKAGYGSDVVWGGSSIVSKYPLLNIGGKNYQINDSTNRSYVKSSIKIGDKEVAIYNTHIVWLEDAKLYEEYKKAQINELIDAVNNDKTPHKIITGDFNTDQSKEELDQLLLNFNGANGWHNTWYDTGEIDVSMKTGSIDHIFTTTNITFDNIGVLEGSPSDHDILYADLILNDNENILPTQLLDNALLEANVYLNNQDNYEIDSINNLKNLISEIENQSVTKENLYQNVLNIRQCIAQLEEKTAPIKAPILHYDFDNNNAIDKNSTYNGKLINNPDFESGFMGNSLITGKGYIEIPENFKLGTKDFTISYWFKSNEDKQDTVFFANKTGDSGKDKGLFICNYDGLYANVGSGNQRYDSSSYNRDKTAMDGAWHQITVVAKRNQELCLYVDGKLSSSNSDFAEMKEMSIDTDTPYVIGAGNSGKYQQKANIDEFKIYDFSLEANQVLKTYNDDTADNINKEALSIALEVASEVTPEQLDKVVPAVANEFVAALENAQNVFDNAKATQEEVDNAFDRLAKAMQLLEFFKGDKAQLQKLATQIASLNASDYIDSTWKAMQPALTKANDVLADENAMQEEVNQAHSDLVKAFLNLRLKPNKDLLAELINKAEGLNAVNYTTASWADMTKALVEARTVYANPKATQEEVDQVQSALTKAIDKLEKKPGSSANNSTNTVKPGGNINGDTNNLKPKTTKAPRTGDTVSVALLLAGLAVSSIVFYKSKREE